MNTAEPPDNGQLWDKSYCLLQRAVRYVEGSPSAILFFETKSIGPLFGGVRCIAASVSRRSTVERFCFGATYALER